jgi:hypothetical protein
MLVAGSFSIQCSEEINSRKMFRLPWLQKEVSKLRTPQAEIQSDKIMTLRVSGKVVKRDISIIIGNQIRNQMRERKQKRTRYSR